VVVELTEVCVVLVASRGVFVGRVLIIFQFFVEALEHSKMSKTRLFELINNKLVGLRVRALIILAVGRVEVLAKNYSNLPLFVN